MKQFRLLFAGCGLLSLIGCNGSDSGNGTPAATGAGTSGSLAAMAFTGNQLHVLSSYQLTHYDLTDPLHPQALGDSAEIWNAQTLFSDGQGRLYVGTSNGIEIYGVPPSQPVEGESYAIERLGIYSHIQAEDPVVVRDQIGYFSIRDGNADNTSFADQVGIVDLTDPATPVLLGSYTLLPEPYGLTVDGSTLWVCDRSEGLSRLLISDNPDAGMPDDNGDLQPAKLLSAAPLETTIDCNDVLKLPTHLLLTAGEGIRQGEVIGDSFSTLSLITVN